MSIEGVSRSFGGVHALRDIDIRVEPGELRAIIGPNGAGKSTLFKIISGHLPATCGTCRLDGQPLDGLPPEARARRGIAIVFQDARIFPGMTVRENVMVGAHARGKSGFLRSAVKTRGSRREERWYREEAAMLLDQVALREWADKPASVLPIGQQRRLQVARALAARPGLLLLDEPASGMRQQERDDLASLLADLHSNGLTMLLVEHDVNFVKRLADNITVLNLGEHIATGTPEQVLANDVVVAAYIGGAA